MNIGYMDTLVAVSFKLLRVYINIYKKKPTTPVSPQIQKYCANASYKLIYEY